jgi:uncharacterized membrane protein YgaE (UPF0421/DUF939 family)
MRVPYFAAAAAILVVGVAYGQRLRRGVDVAIGVTLSVALGDLWLVLFGAGVWQVVLVCAIAMSLATLIGAGPLITTQAGAQSIAVLVMAPSPIYGFERWLDAAIGSTLALLVATVAPSGPLRKPGEVAAKVVAGMAETLEAAADALAAKDEHAASAVLDQVQATEKDLASFDVVAAEGLEVVRHSPFRRRQLGLAIALSDLHEPLDHASRNPSGAGSAVRRSCMARRSGARGLSRSGPMAGRRVSTHRQRVG